MSSKYSIVVPVRNCARYLPFCIGSITGQAYDDYELLVSNDHSEDGTAEFLETIRGNPNVRILEPPERLPVCRHFDFAVSQAVGEWIMTLGGDDGIQPYFFNLADRLVELARARGIRAISSRRAYLFWPGCEGAYGKTAISYEARFEVAVRDSRRERYRRLFSGGDSYYTLPQMYATSIFHRSLLSEIRAKAGTFYFYSISDANMAASASLLEKRFLECGVPLGWVGTSPGSVYRPKEVLNYLELDHRYGSYDLGDSAMYFWGALRECAVRFGGARFLSSRVFTVALLASLRNRVLEGKIGKVQDVAAANRVSYRLVEAVAGAERVLSAALELPRRAVRKAVSLAAELVRTGESTKGYLKHLDWEDGARIDFAEQSAEILADVLPMIEAAFPVDNR
jgi:glycosyltransferase involved in cell wall biosynthesis